MADVNEKDEGPKSNSGPEEDLTQSVIAPSSMPLMNSESTVVVSEDTNNMEEEEEEDEFEGEEEDEEDEEEEPEEDEEETVNDEGKSAIAVNDEGVVTEENNGKAVGEETNKETDAEEGIKKAEDPKDGDKLGEKKVEDPKTVVKSNELGENSKSKGKKPRPKNTNLKKDPQKEPDTRAANGKNPESSSKKKAAAPKASAALAKSGDKPEPSSKKKGSKRVESMGMVFMCTSKTKADCFRYNVLGLPGNKKDQVAKIYKGMRLFLFDVDLRLMYGIFKATGPGGYNLEPKAFKADFPSQVRFTVLDDCLPLAEEKFKGVIKENYYSRNKFEGLLQSEQVRKLCKLFVELGRPKAAVKPPRRRRPVEGPRVRPVESRRRRADDLHTSRPLEKRKRRAREEERRPRSPPPRREKRRHTDYERPRSPVLYDRRSPPPRYLPPPRLPPPAVASPPRLYTYERQQPLDIPPYVHDHRLPDHHTYRLRDDTYRVLDLEPRDGDRVREPRDPYHVYSRDPHTVYTLPPEYHLVSRDYHPPPTLQAPEYHHLSGGSRLPPAYRDVGPPIDYRSSAPEYRSQTHYRY